MVIPDVEGRQNENNVEAVPGGLVREHLVNVFRDWRLYVFQVVFSTH